MGYIKDKEHSLREQFETALKRYSDDNVQRLLGRRIVRAIMWDKSEGRCWYCGNTMNPFTEFGIDHFIPQSSGGGEDFDNLVPCCQRCNRTKGSSSLASFRKNLALKISEVPIFDEEQRAYLRSKGVLEQLLVPEDFEFWYEKHKKERQEHEQ